MPKKFNQKWMKTPKDSYDQNYVFSFNDSQSNMPVKFSEKWMKIPKDSNDKNQYSCLLFIINLISLILSITTFSIALVYKGDSEFSKFYSIQDINDLVKLTSLENIISVCIYLNVTLAVFSLLFCFRNFCCGTIGLILDGVLIFVIIIINGILMLILHINTPMYLEDFKSGMNQTLSEINSGNSAHMVKDCKIFKSISDSFECCALNGPSDFVNVTLADICCSSKQFQKGCLKLIADEVISKTSTRILTPNVVVLCYELLICIVLFALFFCKRRASHSTF
jgi:hypothetical protein